MVNRISLGENEMSNDNNESNGNNEGSNENNQSGGDSGGQSPDVNTINSDNSEGDSPFENPAQEAVRMEVPYQDTVKESDDLSCRNRYNNNGSPLNIRQTARRCCSIKSKTS